MQRSRASRRIFFFAFKRALLLLLTVAFLYSRPVHAQAPSDSSPLLAVEVTGSVRYRSEQIAASTGLQAGTIVTREQIQLGADRLAKLGPFNSVQYRYSTLGPGIKIEYQVTDAPEIPVSFDNFPWLTDEELTTGIKSSVPLFDGMAPAQGAILDEICGAIQKLLDAKGVHAHVSHAFSVSGVGEQHVQVFSAESEQVNIGSIQFSDPLANSDHMVEDRAVDLIGKPFSRSVVEIFELEEVRPIYLTHGYLRVKFGQPAARFADDPKNSSANKLVVIAPIDPGPAYNWNGVTWKGNYSLGAESLDDLVKLRTGEVADGMKIEGAWQAVRDLYGQRGYLDAKVDAVPSFDDNSKRVAYSVSIDEGPQYHMGNLVLTGLSLDGEKRIRAAWKIDAGAVFDKNVYDEFIDTGIHKAFVGSSFHYEKIGRFLQENPHDSKVDVLLDFQ